MRDWTKDEIEKRIREAMNRFDAVLEANGIAVPSRGPKSVDLETPLLGLGEDYEPTKLWWNGVDTAPAEAAGIAFAPTLGRYDSLEAALAGRAYYLAKYGARVSCSEPKEQTIQGCIDSAMRHGCNAIVVRNAQLQEVYSIPIRPFPL